MPATTLLIDVLIPQLFTNEFLIFKIWKTMLLAGFLDKEIESSLMLSLKRIYHEYIYLQNYLRFFWAKIEPVVSLCLTGLSFFNEKHVKDNSCLETCLTFSQLSGQKMLAQINYVSWNQLHCTANLNFGLICKKAKHCWALTTNFSFLFS